ncbi:uridine kinase [Lachnospiraceae bacterium YSD2013]|nr:uridine kinase [Lachnospiraceae bacterium YSD2013]
MAVLNINGQTCEVPEGTPFEEVAKKYQHEYRNTIALVKDNGKIKELFKTVKGDSNVEFITLDDSIGHKTYARSAIMLMVKAAYDVFGKDCNARVKVEFVIGNGYYCSPKGSLVLTTEKIKAVKERMLELVKQNIPYMKQTLSRDDAIALFTKYNFEDKVSLFKYRRSSSVNVYRLEDYYDYYYGYMVPSTGYVKWFDLIPYDKGFMLTIPETNAPMEVKPFDDRPTLFKTLNETSHWSEMLGITNVGELNDAVCRGEINDLILVQEALQERKIGEIAADIVKRGGVKFVMIAGPSSSGKTTFSHRLSVELRTYGLKPHPIGVDDYFVNREQTPKDKDGNYNFECLEAIDVEQFNKDMTALLRGERVELPTFNFKTGRREYKGNFKQLGPDDVLVIEGIHGLNPKMSYSLPDESKYRIYISALTSINIDEHNRIPTTDGRLLRRMVRDARTRGTSAQNTIKMWPSVRRGEEENIFPFQEYADTMFNSILLYELAAFKTYAEPLLFDIGPEEPEYYEAKRLLKFLEYFVALDPKVVPNNSICREFIGGSYFNV